MKIITTLSSDEAKSRLESRIQKSRIRFPFRRPLQTGPVGRVKGNVIFFRTSISSNGPALKAVLAPSAEGTTIDLSAGGMFGRLRMAIPAVFLVFVLIQCVLYLVQVASEGLREQTILVAAGTGLVLLLTTIAIHFARLPLASSPRYSDIEFVRKAVDGEVEATSAECQP